MASRCVAAQGQAVDRSIGDGHLGVPQAVGRPVVLDGDPVVTERQAALSIRPPDEHEMMAPGRLQGHPAASQKRAPDGERICAVADATASLLAGCFRSQDHAAGVPLAPAGDRPRVRCGRGRSMAYIEGRGG